MTGLSLDQAIASDILNGLEDLELPLLSWGVTSVELSYGEVLAVVEEKISNQDADPDVVIRELLRRGLLMKIPGSSPSTYRTRLAETVRLAAQLRQLFGPRDVENPPMGWWQRGKPLVADYRLHTAPRKYPRRDLPADTVLDELGQLPGWNALHSDIVEAQIQKRDLARFQVDATRSIFESAGGPRDRGVIIGAGTGGGKTIAFYLSAFAYMAGQAKAGRRGVQTLALYPRTELLRDQLKEAVSTALEVNAVLRKQGCRPLRIGALYGDTPSSANIRGVRHLERAWRRNGQDLVCPYLSCPRCDRDLIWPEADRSRGRETLRCVAGDLVLDDSEIALTRDSLNRSHPDLLFTTTEMLNRNATDAWLGELLGWSGGRAPSLVLFDEVHTYEGVAGAQVGLLVRRWRHSAKVPMTFVGLSATLRDAARFFSQLVGIDETAVDYIEPAPQDLISEGREYAIALRGDPVSGADLLSTSIQTAMLFGRVMDPVGNEYLYGSKGFLFTDDLDVTNRFYDNLRDAEGGQQRRGGRGRAAKRVLAALRSPDAPFENERFRDGQSWEIVQRIGRPLARLADSGWLTIGRTSSQDSGVDSSAELIVATASLEVGFNDSRVGLVLQHKAPHNAAAFIQRRGRAGRQRGTRPWTIVTLSDYGRDRLAYQAYDSLFNPEIQARSLPVGNRFVLKIQGAQALLDWLGNKLTAGGLKVDPRKLLRAPNGSGKTADPAQSQALLNLLHAVLEYPHLQDELADHLKSALQITAEETQALLWEQPRALMLGVIPTARRRLLSGWKSVERDPGANPGELLPEYVTRTLFDALNVPEVWMELPFDGVEEEALPVDRALREAVPGRVSRRYGHRRNDDRTWLPLPDSGVLELADIVTAGSKQGVWQAIGQPAFEVIRPLSLRLSAPPPEVTSSAQGTPIWATQIEEPSAGVHPADVPEPSQWSTRIRSAGFATHATGNAVETRRMTVGAQCETTFKDGRTESTKVQYAVDGTPAALGFVLTADAMRFELAPLDLNDPSVIRHMATSSWRSLAFTTAVLEDEVLDEVANVFQRGWLNLVYLTAFALTGLDDSFAGPKIHAALANGAWRNRLAEVLQVLYRDSAPNGSTNAPERLVTGLTELSRDPKVTACLDLHGQLLVAPDIRSLTADLAQRAYRDSLAAAILAAAQRACPDAQDRDLIVDVIQAPSDAPAVVWLSETSIGGLGVIEQLVRYYSQDPRRFWGLVESALGPTDHEYVDVAVSQFLEHVVQEANGRAARAMKQLRDAPSAHEADAALSLLRSVWAELEGHPKHAAVAALSTRLLRPGTSATTDQTALGIIKAWDDLETRLGFEVDARIVAFTVGSGRLTIPGMNQTLSADQVFSLLWPRGYQARLQHLEHYQPYAKKAVLDRLLVAAAHDERLPTIDVTGDGWEDRYVLEIAANGAVDLAAPARDAHVLSRAVRRIPALKIDRDYLRVYGEVRKFARVGREVRVRVEIREAVQ